MFLELLQVPQLEKEVFLLTLALTCQQLQTHLLLLLPTPPLLLLKTQPSPRLQTLRQITYPLLQLATHPLLLLPTPPLLLLKTQQSSLMILQPHPLLLLPTHSLLLTHLPLPFIVCADRDVLQNVVHARETEFHVGWIATQEEVARTMSG